MVRSKFPGKPSKIVNRKVVKSSKFCVLQDNESNKAAENISYGLAVFSETFGDHEQVLTAFHGFSPHEDDKARKTADRQQEKVEEEYKASGLNFPQEEAFPIRIDPPTPQALSYVEANLSLIGPVGWHTTRAQCQSLQEEELTINCFKSALPMKLFSPFKTNNLKKHVANRLLQKAKKTNLDTSPNCRMLLSPQLDTCNSTFNRKFVLPSRSLRSRRMIKPSKRFIDAGGVENNPTSTSPNTQAPHTRVIELKKPRLILEVDEEDKAFVAPKHESQMSSQSFLLKASTSSLFDTKEHVKLAELNVFGAPTTRLKRRNSQLSADESPQKQGPIFPCSPSRSSPPDSVSPCKSKVIFRESKLNIISEKEEVKEERSSEKPKKGPTAVVMKSPRISLECGVCGSVCFSRLTKQTLKFEAVCCELCRKFITRMMVRARSSENSVPCDNGQGNCAVSSPGKGESFATKINRCGACWLLLCVQRLVKMPENIRDSLIRMLPANMQGMTVVLPPLTTLHSAPTNRSKRRKKGQPNRTSLEQDLTGNDTISPNSRHGSSTPQIARKISTPSSSKRMPPIARIRRKAALASLANNLKRVRENILSPGSSKRSQCSGNTSDKSSVVQEKLSQKSGTFTVNAEKPLKKNANKNLHKSKDGQTRQKFNPKGPRVKHVCRSASIALGQPLATFPGKLSDDSNGRDPSSDLRVVSAVPPCNSSSVNYLARSGGNTYSGISKQNTESQTTAPIETGCMELTVKSEVAIEFTVPPQASRDSKPLSKSVDARGTGRKPSRPPHPMHCDQMLQRGQRRTLQDLEIMNSQTDARPELISLDFWESYDPDEVCNAGFSLVGFDPFNLKPVCFLCGSAGTKKLIHCASCCEPYHQFCVEMGIIGGPGPLSVELSNKDEWRVDWVCPRCTVCHGCGYNTGHQLTVCQRCHNSYHLECLGTSTFQKSAGERLWVCSLCLRCKSCNSAEVTKFVGNLPFCKVCFKLRQKGNFCPLCQGCYTDDDYSSKMMECGDCKSWVHAKCEGLSDEKYQVLSYLPESVEFICRVCCTLPAAPWWAAVEAELQVGFSNIIKALTKNRKTYAMLKWSPQKSCECQHKPVATNIPITHSTIVLGKRRLSFSMKNQDDIISSSVILTKSSHAKQSTASSVFEFSDDIEAGQTVPISSYKYAKEMTNFHSTQDQASNLVLDCGNDIVGKPDKGSQFSPHTGSQSDSGVGSTDDELKTYSATEEDDLDDKTAVGSLQECTCSNQNSEHPFATLLSIMKKTQSKGYSSVLQFHRDMDQLVKEVDSQDVKELYHQTLQEVFPWFDPKYDRVSRISFPLSPCKPHHGSLLQYQPNFCTPEKSCGTISSMQSLQNLIPSDLNDVTDDYFYYGMNPPDFRTCGLCKCIGDSDASAEGRLLYCGQNEWVHINCALWSAEVFEEIDGALQNVSNALSRGRMIRCSYCGKKGASVGCCAKKCEETLHFPCARSAGFSFMEDKNVFCPLHTKDAPGKLLTRASDFEVSRPVFVELDRRKKKSVESKNVRLMIGSLLIQNLGMLVPDISDQGSNLVPTQFYCSRLFWSSKEPWRIVRYTIKTIVRVPTQQPVPDSGHHITVDHSKENTDGIKNPILSPENRQVLISKHNKSLTYSACEGNAQETENSVKLPHLSKEAKVVEVVMNHILDSVCHKEVDDEVSDVQTSADLLPPELKDAILEDLPQDLLDGISVQDIFQDKFLSFEELSKDDTQEESSITSSKIERIRSVKFSRELKRSKSDVLPSSFTHVDSKLHRRSCSLAWSHKLGVNTNCCKAPRLPSNDVSDQTKVIQELRLSVKPAPSIDLHYCLQAPSDKGKENQSLSWPHILQVDGACDGDLCSSDKDNFGVDAFSHGESEAILSAIRFPTKIIADSKLLHDKIQCLQSVASGTQLQIGLPELSAKKVKSRRVNLKNSSRKKGTFLINNLGIPQLDGANDLSSDSEQEQCHQKPAAHLSEEKPVQCNRCGCTYRTDESLARHLPNCTGDYSLTTSESEAEISEDDASIQVKSVFAPSPDSAISVFSKSLSAAIPVSTAAFPAPVVANSSNSSVIFDGNQPMPAFTNRTTLTQPIVSASNQTQGSCVATVNRCQRSSFNKSKTKQQTVKLVLKPDQAVPQLQQMFNGNNQPVSHQISPSTIQSSLSTQMPHPQTSQVITMLEYPQTQQTGTTVLVQSMPSSTMVPAYLEAFQQQTGQNLQYVATVDPNSGFGKPQYLAAVPSPVIPGAFQLQAISDNQLCLEPGPVAISALTGMQLAQPQMTAAPIIQNQSQVLGALLQNSLPCGVVATTEPIYETIQMFPDQSGSVLVASQPMLTCMETVVSNTYMSMSSSQFVSSVPGMLQGSSTYSSTTTQVFQASKVDPSVLDVPAQYVVVNTRPSLADSALGKLGVISIPQSQIQESAPALSQPQVQVSTINLPTPVSMTACIPPQTLPPAIPTSVVAPIPRIQRTYSKPTKAAKEPMIMRRSVTKIHPSGGKETIKGFANGNAAACKKKPMPSVAGGNLKSMEDKSNASLALIKPPEFQISETSKGTAPSIAVPEVFSSDFISTNIAPAQSITLPDPVKSNPPAAKTLVVPSSSCAVVASKNPPVTFSYRSQNVEKNKDKSSLAVQTAPASSPIPKRKFHSSFQVEQSAKQCGPVMACPTQPQVNPSQLAPAKSTPLPTVVTSVAMEKSKVLSAIKKPTAAISPQFLTNGIQMSRDGSQPLQSCTNAPRSKSLSQLLSPNSDLVKINAHASRPPSPKVPNELAAASSLISLMSSESSQNQVGKNVSLSLVTSSITDSLTSAATNLTVSMNSSAPVPTTKLQSSSPLGQAPLKEINLSSPASKVKVFINKMQEKSGSSVPLAVLKSTSQNVESVKKSDVYHTQSEVPVMFQNKDKSPTSLKLLFQKQAHNGCYRVSSSPGKIDGEFTAVKLADISIITSGGKDKKGGKDESENVEPKDKASLKKSQTVPSGPEIVYEIQCQDGFSYSSTSISEAWQKVFGAVQEARASHKMPPLIHNPFNSMESGHNVLGLGNNSVKYILEQLPGVGNCTKYRPIYHKSRLPGSCFPFKQDDHDLLLKETRSGCARTEPYLSAKKYDMFSWLDSRHRRPPKLLDNNDIDYLTGSRRAASTSLPMAMRFRHLRETSRTSVGVFRSDIHGRGLFCLRDIEAGEMVIEYAGEVIRNTLTDNREKYYQSKGIGCYMFKVDDNFTVDATQKGNAARFINHSCEPNCYSRVVDILGKKHIIIFALRRIPQGEELTYDYKFPIEDEKILCHCLSRRCRKYLN